MDFTCVYCNKHSQNNGWEYLCNRKCYHGMCELLSDYEKNKVYCPDKRLIKYFRINPNPGHSFEPTTRIKNFLDIK
jgi:hypothetical protein